MLKRCMIGLEGTKLNPQEIDWLQHKPPKGVILFARNIESPEQVKALLADARAYAGQNLWAAIDEEGGRVHRMPWTPFNTRTQAADFGLLFKRNPDQAIKEVFNDAIEVGKALKNLGFTHNCAPVLDIFHEKGNPIIGQRSYSNSPNTIATLATACMFGLHDAGVQAIGKHFPGHGRANADSHLSMPEVTADLKTILTEADAFTQLFAKGLKNVMTAHVSYTKINAEIATFSNFWLKDILQDKMEFKGDIWSDDLCMKGCGMPVPEAAIAANKAGCTTLLICEPSGVKALMEKFAS